MKFFLQGAYKSFLLKIRNFSCQDFLLTHLKKIIKNEIKFLKLTPSTAKKLKENQIQKSLQTNFRLFHQWKSILSEKCLRQVLTKFLSAFARRSGLCVTMKHLKQQKKKKKILHHSISRLNRLVKSKWQVESGNFFFL